MNGPSAETAYLFRHALMRDAAYQLQPPTDRAELHTLAADAMESSLQDGAGLVPRQHCAEIARHLRAASPHAQSDALTSREASFLLRGAEHAEQVFDNAMAARLWERRAELSNGPEAAYAFYRAGTSAARGGETPRAAGLFQKAADLAQPAQDLRLLGMALGSLATARFILGNPDEGEALQRRALAILEAGPDAAYAAAARVNLGNQLAATGRPGEALPMFQQAVHELAAAGDALETAVASVNLAICLMDLGRGDEAMAVLRDAIESVRGQGERDVLGALKAQYARCLFDNGETTQALDQAAEAVALCARCGNLGSKGMALGILANLRLRSGLVQDIDQVYDQIHDIYLEIGSPHDQGLHLCEHALALVASGRHSEARPRWRQGIKVLHDVNDQPMIARLTQEALELCRTQGVPILSSDRP